MGTHKVNKRYAEMLQDIQDDESAKASIESGVENWSPLTWCMPFWVAKMPSASGANITACRSRQPQKSLRSACPTSHSLRPASAKARFFTAPARSALARSVRVSFTTSLPASGPGRPRSCWPASSRESARRRPPGRAGCGYWSGTSRPPPAGWNRI